MSFGKLIPIAVINMDREKISMRSLFFKMRRGERKPVELSGWWYWWRKLQPEAELRH